MRTVQHQIIEFAEDALLQLVPGDTPVLVHEKWRAKPEEEEEKQEEEREEWGEEAVTTQWLIYIVSVTLNIC